MTPATVFATPWVMHTISALLLLPTALFISGGLFLRERRRAALLVWAATLVALCVPTSDFVGHTHWAKVGWVPFLTPPIKSTDIAVNILLYAPLGFLSRAGRKMDIRTALRTVLGAAALSLALEAAQLFSHSRFPSATDLVCNVAGAMAGMAIPVGRLGLARTGSPGETPALLAPTPRRSES